jgi:hypothetical protein
MWIGNETGTYNITVSHYPYFASTTLDLSNPPPPPPPTPYTTKTIFDYLIDYWYIVIGIVVIPILAVTMRRVKRDA